MALQVRGSESAFMKSNGPIVTRRPTARARFALRLNEPVRAVGYSRGLAITV